MIEVQDLCFSYGRKEIVRNLSFTAAAGECLILAGQNGCGKSTVLSLLAGILRPRSGSIRIDGRVGYVPQGIALFQDATVEQNLAFFASAAHASVPEELPFGLDALRKERVSGLSVGTQKRVSIACALPGDPQVLLLDEPCAGLDLIYQDALSRLILSEKEKGTTVLFVAHEPSEFARCYDRVLFLDEGCRILTREALSVPEAGDSSLVSFFRSALSAPERE